MRAAPATVERMIEGAGGGALFVRETGAADAPPIVVLHGLCGTGDSVLTTSVLAHAGHRVVSYDARGHGRSEPAGAPREYSFATLCADLRAVIDACTDEPPLLVGASMGGVTAVRLLLDDGPARAAGLVLVTPAFDPEHRLTADERYRARQFVSALRTGDADAFERADPLPGDHASITAAIRGLLRRRLESHADLAAVADAVEVLVEDVAFSPLERLNEIRVPSLVVASHDRWDRLHPYRTAEAWADALPDGRLVTEPPHRAPLAWRPRRLAELVVRFAHERLRPRRSTPWPV